MSLMTDARRPIWAYLEKIGVNLTATQHDELKGLINGYADTRDGAYRMIHETYLKAHQGDCSEYRRKKNSEKRRRRRERLAQITPTSL